MLLCVAVQVLPASSIGSCQNKMAEKSARVTLRDLAEQLDLSIGTVSRALQDHPRINAMTKQRVLRLATASGYVPNLAARYLVSKKGLRIGVNSPREITYFYDAVRRGLDDESGAFSQTGVELQHRVFPRLGEGEREAFEEALDAGLDGLIVIPGDLPALRGSFRRASRMGLPVICLVTDAPGFEKLASVSINTHSIGAIAGDLMGRFTGGRGTLAVTSGDLRVADHIEKFTAFRKAVAQSFPGMHVFPPLENHERPQTAYEQVCAFVAEHPDLAGLYVSTGNGAPVLRALEEAGLLGKLTVISTDVFEDAVPHIRSGAVAATLYERPYSQGRSAFRLMHEYLVEGKLPVARIAFEPLLIMRSNIEAFVHTAKSGRRRSESGDGNKSSRALIDELVLFDQHQ